MTMLVTGGTGLAGSRLLRRFVDSGLECRALVRPGRDAPSPSVPQPERHAEKRIRAAAYLADHAQYGLPLQLPKHGTLQP
jgi:uncharacterized protein YbjT (DUF2867 family)